MGGVYNDFSNGPGEVDVIIVGGGTAGCVVAGRLSDAEPELSILVVERGPDNLDDPAVTTPLFFMENILNMGEPNPRMMFYKGQAEEAIAGRAMTVPAGSILGGGSSINMLTYTRPQRSEMDDWNMPGWTADDMIPYMKKFENYHGPGDISTHGTEGPICISDSKYGPTQLQNQFIKAAASLGFPEATDLQDFDTNQGTQRNLRYISVDGVRQDAAHAYLHPRLQDGKHPNLHVLVEHEVAHIKFKDAKAVGAVIRSTPGMKTNSKTHEIKARRMIVISAGTLGTPLLLERSGVGRSDVLTEAGIDVISDLPGVGEGFQDHNTMLLSYYTSLESNETYDDLLSGKTTLKKMLEEKDEMLTWNAAEITSKVRPTEMEIEDMLSHDARLVWDSDFKHNDNRPVATISTCNGFIAPIPEEDKDARFLSTGSFLLHPLARGHVHITSSNPDAAVDLRTGILSDDASFDLEMAMWLYKKQREIVRRLKVYRGEWPPLHPQFASNSAALAEKRVSALPAPVKNIEYSEEDDKVLRKWITENLAQNWHGIGTCKMASQGDDGVVDEKLDVHGIEHLKVADLSIVPHNLAANTAIMAFAIGEKASDIIASELKL